MKKGFTLSELLIALAILGVISTFTIPKVLQSQTDGKYKAIAKEAAGTISDAFQQHRLRNTITATMGIRHLTQYMNYVKVDSTTRIDLYQTATYGDCSDPTSRCLKLHNGAIMRFSSSVDFGGTGSTNAVYFLVDPDGKETDGTTNGPGKAVEFYLYSNGKIRTYGTIDPNTTSSFSSKNPDSSLDPPWFSWD
jgi:prepilin-type N-terminal cleavage/methylation domain-containing protein